MSNLFLEPCFCGVIPEHAATLSGAFIYCHNPDCFGPQTPLYGSLAEAAAAWNKRVPLSDTEFSRRHEAISVMLKQWGMTNAHHTAARQALEIALGRKTGPEPQTPSASELGKELWEFLLSELKENVPTTDDALLQAVGKHLLKIYHITEKAQQ